MNNQQAIKILKEEKSWESDDRKIDAFNMGIEALETLDKIKRVVDEWSKGEYPYSNNHMCEIKNIIS